jgi:hypothetical protein
MPAPEGVRDRTNVALPCCDRKAAVISAMAHRALIGPAKTRIVRAAIIAPQYAGEGPIQRTKLH